LRQPLELSSAARPDDLAAKLEAERIVEASDLPWTILRATQFYDYCLENSRK
jgi:uncharacterized protein YbjT (DUF2867 family)